MYFSSSTAGRDRLHSRPCRRCSQIRRRAVGPKSSVQVRTRLSGGASRIRTLGPTPSLGPAAWVELGASGSARQDRRRHREARNAVCSRRRAWRAISGNAWGAFTWTKPTSSARSASAASSIWRRPLRLLGKDEVCRDDRICRQSKSKKWPRADSLMREKISLIARFNSLQGPKKFPVRMRRELAHKALS
jgi:hypothetical protein